MRLLLSGQLTQKVQSLGLPLTCRVPQLEGHSLEGKDPF